MNIDKQIKKIIENNTDAVGADLKGVVSQIKQSILKAIMEAKPKKLGVSSLDNIDREYKFFNKALEEFESVIKEILGEQKKVKGVFMLHNPNNY